MQLGRFLGQYRARIGLSVPLAALLAALPLLGERSAPGGTLSWTSLVPPVAALLLVVLTRQVIVALASAVALGAMLHHGVVAGIYHAVVDYFLRNIFDTGNLMICGFALSVLGMVKVTEAAEGVAALVHALRRRLASARAAKLGTATAGLLVFFDDYANTFLIGSSLRPLCDRHGVSREKLAYLVDSTAAPVAGLAIVSTWLSHEVGVLGKVIEPLSLPQDSYALLISALPMRFYCILALILVFLTSAWQRDLGPMVAAERAARAKPIIDDTKEKALPVWVSLNAVAPISVLVVCVITGLVIDGGGFETPAQVVDLAAWQRLLAAVNNSTLVLLISGLLSVAVAFAFAHVSGRAPLPTSGRAFGHGVRAAAPALGILVCAWALGDVCEALSTGPYLVRVLQGSIAAEWVPLLSFAVAALVAVSTGTSWGTMAIVMPAAVPLAYELGGLWVVVPSVAAVLDGAIFGDHCSPVSDTTVLSSTACDCPLLNHVTTQLPYALLAMLGAAVAYCAVSLFRLPALAGLALGVVVLLLGVSALGRSTAPSTAGQP